MFATHIDNQLRNLELQEDWRDEKYSELEAEVEIERGWSRLWMRRLLPFRAPIIQRVPSLSKALESSTERLVLLEGEPGAGKSVALRHLARLLAQRAARRKDPRTVIPLYINLKSLDVRPSEVSPDKIREFVLATLNEVNSRDVQDVLDDEFDRGLEDGTWLFLFDSFDEIPDVLSAQDTRQIVPRYAHAIANFLGPFTRCRGIVASRDFNSPDVSHFIRFRILRLSSRQQRKLISRADLPRVVDRALRDGLATASQDVSTFAANPMFLGLLCEHMRNGIVFPLSSHTVFEEYLANRLRRDATRIRTRFDIGVELVRSGAEEIAFLMASTPRIGLTPPRSAFHKLPLERLSSTSLDTVLNVLEYTKLGRTDKNVAGETTFSFVHRRFQEYFATCEVIRDFNRVPVATLFDNDQWRETAVTLLQLQNIEVASLLVREAQDRLELYVCQAEVGDFRWPPGCLHLLGILANGLETHPDAITNGMRSLVDRILEKAWDMGHRLDKRRALVYVGIASNAVAERLLIEAFRSPNEILRDAASRSAGMLPQLSIDLRQQIRRTLLGLSASGSFYFKRAAIVAQLKRLASPMEFLRLVNLLTFVVPSAFVLSTGGLLTVAFRLPNAWSPAQLPGLIVAIGIISAAGVYALRMLLVTSAWRRGRLAKTDTELTLLKERVARATTLLICYILNSVWCLFSASEVAGGSLLALFLLFSYAALWPVAVIWSARGTSNLRPFLGVMLPAVLVTDTTAKMFRWGLTRSARRLPSGTGISRRICSLLIAELKRGWPQLLRGLGMFIVFLVLLGGLAWLAVGNIAPLLVSFLGWIGITVLVASTPVLLLMWGIDLIRPSTQARTIADALTLLARTRTDFAFRFVLAALSRQQILRDPTFCLSLEGLVGEIEKAQMMAEKSPKLLLRTACPTLARCKIPSRRIIDAFPMRLITQLKVRALREECIDRLARLAEQT